MDGLNNDVFQRLMDALEGAAKAVKDGTKIAIGTVVLGQRLFDVGDEGWKRLLARAEELGFRLEAPRFFHTHGDVFDISVSGEMIPA